MTTQRTIIPVRIIDDEGATVAEIDSFSTSDAMAHFLRTRGLDEDATEQSVKRASHPTHDLDGTPDDVSVIVVVREWNGRYREGYRAEVVS